MENGFKQYFGLQTNVRYLHELVLDPKIGPHFATQWRRCYRTRQPPLSPYRKARFAAFFRQLNKGGGGAPYRQRVLISYISPEVGFGVFAQQSIAPYATLDHYTGILRHEDQIDPSHDSTFAFTGLQDYAIDGMEAANWTRFMNHSPAQAESTNVLAWEYADEQGPRIVFTACRRGIEKGEQLLYSYGQDYWDQQPDHIHQISRL